MRFLPRLPFPAIPLSSALLSFLHEKGLLSGFSKNLVAFWFTCDCLSPLIYIYIYAVKERFLCIVHVLATDFHYFSLFANMSSVAEEGLRSNPVVVFFSFFFFLQHMKSKFKTASTTKPLIAIPTASLVDTSDDPPLEDGVACGDIVVPPDGRRQRGGRTAAKKLILERVLWFGAVKKVLQLRVLELQVPDETLSSIMSMGYKEREAEKALSMNNLHVGSAVDFLVEEKAKMAQKQENLIDEKKSWSKNGMDRSLLGK